MKTVNSQVVMALGGFLIATLATGCFGGGGPGYSNSPYGYNSSYGSYGNSYPYSGYSNGYSYPQRYGNSYNAGYQNGVRADDNRDRRQDRYADQHAEVVHTRSEVRTDTQHSAAGHDQYSRRDSEQTHRSERN